MNIRHVVAVLYLVTAPSLAASEVLRRDYLATREPARHALVIGNGVYAAQPPLPSALNDAVAMQRALEALGFKVFPVKDLDSVETLNYEILPAFRPGIEPGDMVVVYFSGHGFGHGPFNYLAPTSLPGRISEEALGQQAIAIESLERALRARSPGMIVFLIDACRNMAEFAIDVPLPFPPAPGDGPEPATVPARLIVPKGMGTESIRKKTANVIAFYAAEPGSFAYGSTDAAALSLFTESLAARLTKERGEVKSIFSDVVADVLVSSGETQQPTSYHATATDVYLGPVPEDELAAQREAWLAALNSGSDDAVRWFSHRFALSPHALSARAWLEDHAAGGTDAPFTLASPVAVERSWGRRTTIGVPTTGLGYARKVDASPSTRARTDRELGLLARGEKRLSAASGRLLAEARSLLAHGRLVATRDHVARAAPSTNAEVVGKIAFGSPVDLAAVEQVSPGNVWVKAFSGGSDTPVFLKLEPREIPTQPIALGDSLAQVEVAPHKSYPYLVEEETVRAAVRGLRDAGRTVTWVSVTSPGGTHDDEVDDQRGRLAHAGYVLKQAGVDSRRITIVGDTADVRAGHVRLRFFGY